MPHTVDMYLISVKRTAKEIARHARFYDVAGSSLSFSSNECSTLGYASQRLAKIFSTTHEGYFERVFVDVVFLVSWGEDLRLVDIVNADGL
jgi:hypothetical protein